MAASRVTSEKVSLYGLLQSILIILSNCFSYEWWAKTALRHISAAFHPPYTFKMAIFLANCVVMVSLYRDSIKSVNIIFFFVGFNLKAQIKVSILSRILALSKVSCRWSVCRTTITIKVLANRSSKTTRSVKSFGDRLDSKSFRPFRRGTWYKEPQRNRLLLNGEVIL